MNISKTTSLNAKGFLENHVSIKDSSVDKRAVALCEAKLIFPTLIDDIKKHVDDFKWSKAEEGHFLIKMSFMEKLAHVFVYNRRASIAYWSNNKRSIDEFIKCGNHFIKSFDKLDILIDNLSKLRLNKLRKQLFDTFNNRLIIDCGIKRISQNRIDTLIDRMYRTMTEFYTLTTYIQRDIYENNTPQRSN